ncbi:MAG: FHA domain-containing protein [Chloroflexota bacterium]|nr:MAG: FHA domain-containing protein [Chloroflexota bacterium]
MANLNESGEWDDSANIEHLLKTGPVHIDPDHAPQIAPRDIPCPRCERAMRVGELVCPNCGLVIGSSNETHRIEEPQAVVSSGPQQAGEAIIGEGKPITFEVNGSTLDLSIHETLVLGRQAPNEPPPDVDLTPFGAQEHGVSRRHARLQRRGSLIYITDLNSTNKTYLNGRCLIPEGERLLRSGDEIRLGRLKIRVRF